MSKTIVTKDQFVEFLKNEPRYLLWDIIGSIAYAVGIYTFAAHADFAPGGISGAAIILNYLFKFPIGTISVLLNIPIVLISYRSLGKDFLLRTLQTLIISAIFLDVVAPQFPVYQGESLLAAIFGGGISGLGLAMIYNAGSCTGGTDLIIMTLRKHKPHLSVGQITMMIDGILITIGAFIYGKIDAVLYGILFTVVSTFIIDRMMDGYIGGKMALIISTHNRVISERIQREIGRGATFLKGEGVYTGEERDVLMCACSRRQLPQVRSIVKECDQSALVIVMDYSEVRGKNFQPLE